MNSEANTKQIFLQEWKHLCERTVIMQTVIMHTVIMLTAIVHTARVHMVKVHTVKMHTYYTPLTPPKHVLFLRQRIAVYP